MSIATSALARPRRGRLYIIIGAVLAVLAFGAAALIASLPLLNSTTGGTKVVVAGHDIKARTVIQASDLALLAINPTPPGAFVAIKDVSGKAAKVDIPANEPITANVVAQSTDLLSGSDLQYLPIPNGWVGVTIPTSEQVGVGGYVQPSDRISILASINTSVFGQSPGVGSVRTVFRDIEVLRVGPSGGSASGGSVTSSLTVLMTSCDSEFLFWLLTNATLKYELESYKDYQALPTEPSDACPKLTSATGVGPLEVDKRWHFTAG
ncbi:MAG TPA: Flp pilus assembly protein CpaB [Candidatus Dormibacteraeota bacterium]|nr:Flp pilus assembly protein CpaB [Candidatus Dormibacteraeota bacterium]HEX2681214.1 Flp pilus assembly protein CpaB [Candidatus Dormibacteraeota bacterium]